MGANKIVSCVSIAGIVFFTSFSCDKGPNDPPPDTGLEFSFIDQEAQTVAANGLASFRVVVKNGSRSPVTISCIKKADVFPDSQWSASVCAGGTCFPPFVDSTDAGPLAVGGVDTCALDIQAGSEAGTARVSLTIYNKTEMTQRYENTFSCTVAF